MGYIKIDGKLIYGDDSSSNEVTEHTWIDENNMKHSEISCKATPPNNHNIFNNEFQKQLNAFVKEHYKSLVKKP